MNTYLQLEQYPLLDLSSHRAIALINRCRKELSDAGTLHLPGLLRQSALNRCLAEVMPLFATSAFTHKRMHNIFFDDKLEGLPSDHPALSRMQTVSHTICADQLSDSLIVKIYEWRPLRDFLAAVIGETQLHLMADPMARVNVMAYYEGESLNWHFDRAQFTVTLLLQAPNFGGNLELAYGLKDDETIDFEGIASLLKGSRAGVESISMEPGTLNIFQGRDIAHRTTPAKGSTPRVVAIFSYFAQPGRVFTAQEQLGFYGRTAE